jgi:hypothetical protein
MLWLVWRGELVFASANVESFSLREIRHAALETSAVKGNGADVQIGGGVRVGEALQAIIGFDLIAM